MNSTSDSDTARCWLNAWFDIARQAGAMSQRRVMSIERHGGGLDSAAAVATERDVHLELWVLGNA